MRQWIAALLFACMSLTSVAQAQLVFSYISRVQIGSDRAGTCYASIPSGYPASSFTRVAGACGGGGNATPSPSPTSTSGGGGGGGSATPTPVPTGTGSGTYSGGSLNGVTGLNFINPSSCGTTVQPLPVGSDLTGCTAGYLIMAAASTSAWTYSGYTGPPVVFVTPIADPMHVVGFTAAPSATGFTLQSVSLSTGVVSTTDTSVVSYLILGNNGTSVSSPVSLTPSTVSINIGDAPAQITATQLGNTTGYQASSDTPSVATVSVSGSKVSVTGIAPGSANITVLGTAGQPSALLAVTVLAGVTASANSVTILQNTSSQVTTTQVGNSTFTPTSSNTGVATVSQSGAITTITGVAAGTATITITGAGGRVTRVTATVVAPATNSVIVAQSSVSLNAGTSSPVIVLQTGNSAGFTVTSSNATYVTGSYAAGVVTINGVLPTSSPVTLTIADAGSSGQSATISVTVTSAPIVLSQSSSSLLVGASATANVSQVGNGSTGYTATSSNPSSVSVVSPVVNGILSFTALTANSTPATITVAGAYGRQSTVTVSVSANGVSVSQSTASVTVGASAQILVSQPGNTGGYTATTPDSGATVGASVNNSTGVVTLTGVGVTSSPTTVTITGDGGQSATIAVTVTAAVVNSITLNPTSQTIANGSTGSLAYTYTGGGTLHASSNSASVTVTASALSGGTIVLTAASYTGSAATITVTDGTVSSTASVMVTANPITLAPSSQTIANGSTNGTIAITQAGSGTFTVSSNSASVVPTVSGSTVSLTAASPTGGTPAVITVSRNGATKTATVSVSTNAITISPSTLSLVANGSTGTINAQQTANTTFTLSSTDTNGTYATFALGAASGGIVPIIVTPHAATTGTPVTLTVSGGGTSQTATITVGSAPISLGLSGNALSVQAGRVGTFTPTQSGNSAGFTATSDTPSVATVPTGTSTTISVTGVATGTANITVSGGGATAVATVTVTPGRVGLSSMAVTIVAGQSISLTASQVGNPGNTYTATDTGGNASVTTNTSATNNVVITGLSPTSSADTVAVSGVTSGGVAQTTNVSVTVTAAPIVLTAGGASTVAAGSTATFAVTQTGNVGSYTVSPSNGFATATVLSQSSSGATIRVTGVSPGTLNVVVSGQGQSLTVPFTVTAGAITISPNITTLTLAAGASSSAITVTEPGNTTFTASVPAGTTSVSTTVTGNQVVITGNSVTGSPVNVTIGGASGAPSNPVIAVTVTGAPAASDAQLVSALVGAGATAVWPMNDGTGSVTSLANGVNGGAAITLSSGTGSGLTQAFPLVVGSSHSTFFNPLVGTASTGQVLSASSPWTVGVTIYPSALPATNHTNEIWTAGDPISSHTGVALGLSATGQVKILYGVTVSGGTATYNTVTAVSTIGAGTGPATAFTQGHVVTVSWTGTAFTLALDGATPVTLTPTNTFVSSATPLSFGNTTYPSGAGAFLGYMQYGFYAGSALSANADAAIYQEEIGNGGATSGAPAVTVSPSSATLTAGGSAATFTVLQTGYTSGFSISATPNPACATATIAPNSNQLTITPGSSACSTALTIQGNGTSSLRARVVPTVLHTSPPH